jgi:hypothetical protein
MHQQDFHYLYAIMIILTIRVEATIKWLLGHHPKDKQINHVRVYTEYALQSSK